MIKLTKEEFFCNLWRWKCNVPEIDFYRKNVVQLEKLNRYSSKKTEDKQSVHLNID